MLFISTFFFLKNKFKSINQKINSIIIKTKFKTNIWKVGGLPRRMSTWTPMSKYRKNHSLSGRLPIKISLLYLKSMPRHKPFNRMWVIPPACRFKNLSISMTCKSKPEKILYLQQSKELTWAPCWVWLLQTTTSRKRMRHGSFQNSKHKYTSWWVNWTGFDLFFMFFFIIHI